MQSQNYQRTMNARFIAYMVQAVVNNFVPLLFVTFQQTYDIPMSKITLLITLNFLIQLVIDLLSAGFVDKIGYRASLFAEKGLGVTKTIGDLAGPMSFAMLMGTSRLLYGKYGEKWESWRQSYFQSYYWLD